jgi:dihydrolipoamide dehydrogenase
MEFAYFYHTMGTQITIVEMMPSILPVEDKDVSAAMGRLYKKHGMNILTSTTTTAVEKTKDGVRVTVAPWVVGPDGKGKPDESKKETIEADRVLLAVGVKGRFDGLFDEKNALGLETFKDHIKTDYIPGKTKDEPIDYKTNLPGIYAVGDVIGPPWLAHVASEEAVICIERIAWRAGKLSHEPIPVNYTVIPGCTYCLPQVASVGFTEQALIAQGLKKGVDYQVGMFPMSALGKAIASAHTDGFTKIIRALPRGEVLGAHIMGDQATELEATTEELICTIHAHPTMHESVHEAALASEGRVIHA